MKKILLTVVLGVAVVAVGQDAAHPAQGQSATPAQGQPAASQSSGPVIKDPAEYNAYVAAVQQKDANAKISGLEAFLTQYPSSVMKNQALEILMQTYQAANNAKKTMETATKLVAADSCNMRALALLAYFDRVLAQAGDPNGNLADGKKYGEQGMACSPKITDPDIMKMKDQMTGIFNAAIGIADYVAKDYPGAAGAASSSGWERHGFQHRVPSRSGLLARPKDSDHPGKQPVRDLVCGSRVRGCARPGSSPDRKICEVPLPQVPWR